MSSGNPTPTTLSESPLPKSNIEIENLRKMRATLEAVREASEKIHQDLVSATENQISISEELQRTSTAIDKL